MKRNNTFPLIIDGHNDTLLDLHLPDRGNGRSFFAKSEQGHLDLPRAYEGGFGGGFFAIFVPGSVMAEMAKEKETTDQDIPKDPRENYAIEVGQQVAEHFTAGMIELLFQLEKDSAGKFRVVRSVAQLQSCLEKGVMAAILHIEGAEAIDQKLRNLDYYYDKGLRSIGITWSRPNAFGHGVPFKFNHSPDTGPGLTEAGKSLVRACNDLGIMLDLSHLNEKGFWDVASLSNKPLVATHSGVHKLCPSTRNLTDRQLKAIGYSGGVVGINYHTGFLCNNGEQTDDVSLSEIVRHINYVVEHIGIEHVALGSDFDGARMPGDLGDVAGLPKLMVALQEEGYGKEDLKHLAHGNWIRVLDATWME